MMNWENLDWAALDRLRQRFLSGAASPQPYWAASAELDSYDFTYGRRIGWKWDAVLRELDGRGWRPPSRAVDPAVPVSAPPAGMSSSSPAAAKVGPGSAPDRGGAWSVVDWGCGSGVAGRRVVAWLGPDRVSALRLWDHSRIAVDFAAGAARAAFPGLTVEAVAPAPAGLDKPVGVLVISHVLNELPPDQQAALRRLIGRADAVLWVEPGTHVVSRALIGIREQLRDRFRFVAPCTHQAECGMRIAANARHWCHHFAPVPPGIHADSNWGAFARRAGIDLRSVPYSYLVGERPGARVEAEAGTARVIGETRIYKGFARILSCDADGVTELILQKRDDPVVFRQLKRPQGSRLYRWTRHGDRITAVAPGAATLDSRGAL